MSGDIQWNLNVDTEKAKQDVKDSVLAGITEVFELDIKPDAIQNSPYLTGTNRRSIDTLVAETPAGPEAKLFTQSGYGGYLELGTRKMKAQPYLYPAFNKFVNKLSEIIGTKVRAIKPQMFKEGG